MCCRQVLRGADRNELNYRACPSPFLTRSVGGGGWHYRTFLHVLVSFVPFRGKAQQCVVNMLVRHVPQGGPLSRQAQQWYKQETCNHMHIQVW